MKYFQFEFSDIVWNFMKSWNPIAFSKIVLDFMILCEILLDLMKYIMKSIMKSDGFHMNLCWISWKLVKSCWI